ncbi:hypothetical protein GCM10028868_29460 [Virgibacillus kimchii]
MLTNRTEVKEVWDCGTVVPRPTVKTRYRWALELDVAKYLCQIIQSLQVL